jgi:histidine triad (HIT) family protein
MSERDACIFCKIVAGQSPASVVYEDEDVIAFMAVPQAAHGHVLVVPREHYADCFELDYRLAGPLFGATIGVARAVKRLYQPDGISLVQNNGTAAGQSVFHVHVHVLPRTHGVPARIDNPSGISDRAELDRLAAEIAAALEGSE